MARRTRRGGEAGTRDDEPGRFPMRVATRLTGLSPELVRAWERRYGAIAPARTGGNARRYSAADIARLGKLRDAVAAGHAISAVAGLSDAELEALAPGAPASVASGTATLRARYLEAIARFDLAAADAMLARAAQLAAPREVVLALIAPLLREVGERWHDGALSVAEEHAVSAQTRAILSTLLRTGATPPGAPRVLVATPDGHRHELGAMIAAVLAAERGVQSIYLGADVPWAELARTARTARAGLVVLSMPLRRTAAAERRERDELAGLACAVEVWVGAPAGRANLDLRGARVFHDYAPYERALALRFPA